MVLQRLERFLRFGESAVHYIIVLLIVDHHNFVAALLDKRNSLVGYFTIIGQNVIVDPLPLLEQHRHAGVGYSHQGGLFPGGGKAIEQRLLF